MAHASENERQVEPSAQGDNPAVAERQAGRPDHAALLAMQGTAGNQAVVAMLRGQGLGAAPVIPDGQGVPMPPGHRAAFEQALDHPLGHVRLHSDRASNDAAQAIGADAFTVGSHVYFADGAFKPGTADGDRNLGHELIHVVQHDAGEVPKADPSAENGLVSSPSDPLEREAYARESSTARAAATSRADGAEASPVTPAPQVPTVAHRDAAAPAEQIGPGPEDDQLLPPVPREPPKIGTDTATPPPPPPPTPPGPPPARPPAPPAVPVSAIPGPAAPAGPGPVTDWVPPPQPVTLGVQPEPATEPDTTEPVHVTAAADTFAAQAAEFTASVVTQQQAAVEGVQAEISRLAAAAQTAAGEARAQLTATYDEQLQAVPAATATALAMITAAAEREHANITAQADNERQRLTAAHDTERQQAIAHIDDLRQQTLAAGETEAARSVAESEQRAVAITAEGEAVSADGEPPSVEAQRKSTRRIAERAAGQCRETGTRVAAIVRQEAAHHAATNYEPMLRDYLVKLDESRPGAEQAIVEFVQAAGGRVDQIATQAATATRVLGEQTTMTLQRERGAALAEIDAWEAQATAALQQAGAHAQEVLTAQFAPVAAELTTATEANVATVRQLSEEDQADAAAELTANLQAGREQLTGGLTQLRDAAVTGMSESFDQLSASLRETVEGRRSTTQALGTKTQQGVQAGAEGAAEGMAAATASFQQRLAAGVTASIEKLTSGGTEFRAGTQGIHGKALKGLAQAVDDGLASEDALLAKARSELAATPAKVDAKYSSLKQQAASAPVPAARIHRGIWSSITGFVSDLHDWAKKKFADWFGEFLGGLLLGIIEGLIIVGVGLLLSWAVGAVVGFFVVAAETAAIITVVIMLVAGVGLNIYNRFEEFYADNPGEDAGFWRGLGLVGLGIADLTGIPYIIEGAVGQRAFGAKMDKFDSAERLGMGLVFFGAALVSAKNLLRGRPKITDRPRTRPAPEPHPEAKPPAGLTPKLEAIRAGLKDPRAIEQFDKMFADVKGDAAKMERIMDGFAKKGSVEERLISDWEKKNPVPEPPRGDALDRVPAAKAKAVALREEMVKFREEHPEVKGIAERIKALDAEIESFDQMLDGRLEASSTSLTGREANVESIAREFEIAKRTPGLTGMSRMFSLDGRPNAVEVDTVGEGGKLWVESKDKIPYGTESSNWKGVDGKGGDRVQAQEMVRAAQQNPVDGKPPKVVWEYPKGVSPEVKGELQGMGIEVRGPEAKPKPIPVPVPHGDKDDKDDNR